MFYFFLVYDGTRALMEESQRLIKMNQMELREKIRTLETENGKYGKQIDRFQAIYEDTDDAELLRLTLLKEKELNSKKEQNVDAIGTLKCELDGLNKKSPPQGAGVRDASFQNVTESSGCLT